MGANSTGTPTSLGIPTLNPAQDILKSDGVNEIVQSIDGKIAARMFAPASPTNLMVVKWSTSGAAWIADFVDPAELKQSGATTGQVLLWNGAKWAPGAVAKANVTRSPGSPAGTSSTTQVMLGLNQQLTPTSTGNITFWVFGLIPAPSFDTYTLNLKYGTGTPPTNNAAVTGTTLGHGFSAAVNTNIGVTFMGTVAGLTVGTPYWWDIAASSTGPNSITLSNVTTMAVEV